MVEARTLACDFLRQGNHDAPGFRRIPEAELLEALSERWPRFGAEQIGQQLHRSLVGFLAADFDPGFRTHEFEKIFLPLGRAWRWLAGWGLVFFTTARNSSWLSGFLSLYSYFGNPRTVPFGPIRTVSVRAVPNSARGQPFGSFRTVSVRGFPNSCRDGLIT